MKRLASILALLLVVGCGNDARQVEWLDIAGEVGSSIQRGGQGAALPSPEAFAAQFDAAVDGPLLIAFLPDRAALAALVPNGENAGHITWSTEERQTLTFRQGVLTATRGLGDDLMSSEVAGTIAALRNRGGTGYSRTYRRLSGAGSTVVTRMNCSMAPADVSQPGAIVLTETCRNEANSTTSVYAVNGAGRVMQSIEFVSASVGNLQLLNMSD